MTADYIGEMLDRQEFQDWPPHPPI
jgi:hypothetical protein